MKSSLFLIIIFFGAVNPSLVGQGNWQYGFGASLKYADYFENISPDLDIMPDFNDKYIVLPSIDLRADYKVNDRLKILSGVGLQWEGAKNVQDGFQLRALYANLPIFMQSRLSQKFAVGAGLSYNMLLSLRLKNQYENLDMRSYASNDHYVSGSVSCYYILNKHVELGLGFTQFFSEVFAFEYTDELGVPLGRIGLRNQNLKISLVFTNLNHVRNLKS